MLAGWRLYKAGDEISSEKLADEGRVGMSSLNVGIVFSNRGVRLMIFVAQSCLDKWS